MINITQDSSNINDWGLHEGHYLLTVPVHEVQKVTQFFRLYKVLNIDDDKKLIKAVVIRYNYFNHDCSVTIDIDYFSFDELEQRKQDFSFYRLDTLLGMSVQLECCNLELNAQNYSEFLSRICSAGVELN